MDPTVGNRIFWRRQTIYIDNLDNVYLPSTYRFRNKEQLHRLHELLHLNQQVQLANGQWISSEEALLITFERLHYPCNYADLAQKYQLDPTNRGRCVHQMIYFISQAWG